LTLEDISNWFVVMFCSKIKNDLFEMIFECLYDYFGPQHWWPGETIEEIIIGAILTQNTNWINVECAIKHLKKNGLLSLKKLLTVSPHKICSLIRPSGYYNIKMKRLRAVSEYFVKNWNCDFDLLKKAPIDRLRTELLSVYGIGPETADSILLYALEKPVFVVDTYTRRMGERHGLFSRNNNYDSIRLIFESSLKGNVKLYNEYHALIVRLGKNFCKSTPLCIKCPLHDSKYYI